MNYSLEPEEDSVQAFYINFEACNENLRFCIRVFFKKSVCLIICSPKTKISLEYRDKAIQAMNEFNGNSMVVSGFIGEQGNVVFSLGRNMEGNTFSKEAFIADFHSVYHVADMKTAQILKKAYAQASEE